jgi:membrane protease YdiL (CAAX protease family)
MSIWITITRILIIILTAGLGWTTYQSHLLLKEYRPEINLLLSMPEQLGRLTLIGVCSLLAWASGLPAVRLGLHAHNLPAYIGGGVLIGAGIIGLIHLITLWAINRFGRDIYSPWVVNNVLPQRPAEWLLTIPAMLIAVAMEELLFRSLWLGVFANAIPLTLLIIITSLIFGAMHSPQGLLGMLIASSINILLSLLFVWSAGLLLPLTAHYTVNILQLIVAHYRRDWLENYSIQIH